MISKLNTDFLENLFILWKHIIIINIYNTYNIYNLKPLVKISNAFLQNCFMTYYKYCNSFKN